MAAATRYVPSGHRLYHPALADEQRLRVGGAVFDLTEVAAYETEERTEIDNSGQWLCAIVYGAASALFLIGILLGMDWKFAIAVIFLGAVSGMSIADVRGVKPVTLYCLHMRLRNGREVSFVDADARVIAILAQRIDGAQQR